MPRRAASALGLLLALAVPLAAQTPPEMRADYERLQARRYRTDPHAVPAGGLRYGFEGASWELSSGRLWLGEPTAQGAVTGLAFEGKGRFRLDVPDALELAQLRRFARRPQLQALDLTFTSCLVRSAGPPPFLSPPAAGRAPVFAPLKLAVERQEHWLTERGFDVDARVLAALATPGDVYLRVDMKTDEFGWLTFDYDGRRMEEIRVESYNFTYPWTEVWLALDRPSERDARGRATSRPRHPLDLLHADITADMTRAGRDKGWMAGRFRTGLVFRATPEAAAGSRALQLYLHPLAKVTAVREGEHQLPFVRDAIGLRDRMIDDRIFDESLLVLLDRPLESGEERRIEVEYELEMRNFAGGRAWYPYTEGDETILNDPHTARLELTVRSRHEARAMGRRVEGEGGESDGRVTSVWVVDEPTKMLTFSYAQEKFHEERVAPAGGPEVICFGERVGLATAAKFHNVGADVANSVQFFSQLFAEPLPPRPLYVTAIDGDHGQSFDGFLQLSQTSFQIESPGASELFRAHEVAHQWWGHLVGAASYRDAWLGEAFAEYSAMMFVDAVVPGGKKLFAEALRADADELTGSLKSGFSKFARPGVSLVNRAYGDRMGPIGLGWRANTGEVRTAYSSQVYNKGALVLHMLRRLVGDMTKSDEAFFDILRDFLRAHRGGVASTADFVAAVARRVPADWSWFFDEWVGGTAIPTYRWSYAAIPGTNDRSEYVVKLSVHQRDVPEGFKMVVPVAVELADGTSRRLRVLVDQPDSFFPLTFPARPKSLVFNPDDEVLSRTKREG
jgi:hypothetical protein